MKRRAFLLSVIILMVLSSVFGQNNTYIKDVMLIGGSNKGDELEKFVFNEDHAKLYIPQDGELQIFDVMGRLVSTQHVTNVETIEKPSQPGVYIFKFNGKTQKIVVR